MFLTKLKILVCETGVTNDVSQIDITNGGLKKLMCINSMDAIFRRMI